MKIKCSVDATQQTMNALKKAGTKPKVVLYDDSIDEVIINVTNISNDLADRLKQEVQGQKESN